MTVVVGGNVAGTPPPTYQWRRDGQDIPGATGASHTISAVAVPDAGNYDVVVANVCGTIISSAATLTVNTAPVITQQPASATQCDGRPVSFSVTVTGAPAPTCRWRKDGVNVPGATGNSYSIAAVNATHAGGYDVVMTNFCGAVTSNAATLTVWPAGSGDVNDDGRTDAHDIEGFVAEVLGPGGPGQAFCAADTNGDGAVDPQDLPLFVARLVRP